MSSVSEGKTCEIDWNLISNVEVIGRTLDSSSDEMTCKNEEETFSEWRAGMMIPLCFKTLLKVEKLFLEDEKILLTLNPFFIVGSLFDGKVLCMIL